MKRASTWSLQLYSPYVALALFLVLVLTTFNYISLSSQQNTLMARSDQQQKEKDLLQVRMFRMDLIFINPSRSSYQRRMRG